ncbi:MAG: hypothetical protein NVS3B26_11650 [Mycobacteriales bacterium]
MQWGDCGPAQTLACSADGVVIATSEFELKEADSVLPLLLLRLEQRELDKDWVVLTPDEALVLADWLRAHARALLDNSQRS